MSTQSQQPLTDEEIRAIIEKDRLRTDAKSINEDDLVRFLQEGRGWYHMVGILKGLGLLGESGGMYRTRIYSTDFAYTRIKRMLDRLAERGMVQKESGNPAYYRITPLEATT